MTPVLLVLRVSLATPVRMAHLDKWALVVCLVREVVPAHLVLLVLVVMMALLALLVPLVPLAQLDHLASLAVLALR